MKKLILFLLLLKSTVLFAQLKVHHDIAENFAPGETTFVYVLGNDVPLREKPDRKARLLANLPIGQELKLLERKDTLELRGVQSAWYRTRVNGKNGWVWGGSLARQAFGSNEDPEIKFLFGFSHKQGAGEQLKNYIQIRAVKNQAEMATIIFPTRSPYILPNNLGRKGLQYVSDILSLEIPCLGGCGCSGGAHIIAWDGREFHEMITLWGTADAEFSEGNSIIFPSDMAGEKGYIKICENLVDNTYDYNRNNIMRRIIDTRYFRWNGHKLIPAPEKQVKQQTIYYDYEAHVEVPEPEENEPEN